MPTDYQILQSLCREKLGAFTQKSFGLIESADLYQHNWHIDCIAEHLTAVWENQIKLLIINMPPRTLKTLTTSVAFPAWGLGKNPSVKFMLTSFKGSLAEKMTRKTRMIMKSKWYRDTYPGTEISAELDRQYYFETTKGGQYFSSAMASVTGEGADIQISDDPVAPDEALSDKIRESTNDTIRNTLFSRFNDPRMGRFILNMQRLHEDDPTGNLLKDGGWHHLKLPAEAVKPIFISLNGMTWEMKPGELLFPERFTKDVLEETRSRLGDYNYAGQYLQEPTPLSGGMINPLWVQFYAQGGCKPKEMNIVILVDPAGGDDDEKRKKDKLTDWTAMVVVGLAPDNNYYLLDVIRDKLNSTDRIDTLFMLHRKWSDLGGKSPKVGYERYSMQSDTHYIKKKMQQDGYNFAYTELAGPKSKTSRIARMVPDLQNGRWFFPHSLMYVDTEGRKWDLMQEILKTEMPHIPYAKHDDCCFVAGTMIATRYGPVQIQSIKIGDMVLTPDGYRRVYDSGFTGIREVIATNCLTGTPHHPVYTIDSSYINMDTISRTNDILENDLCGWTKIALLKSLNLMVSDTAEWGGAENIISHKLKTGKILRGFMLLYGNFIREKKYLMAMKLTTKTVTLLIAILRIWSAYRGVCIGVCLKSTIKKRWQIISQGLGHLLPNGTNQMLDVNGIDNMPSSSSTKYSLSESICANNAPACLNPENQVTSYIVCTNAVIRPDTLMGIENMAIRKSVRFAGTSFPDSTNLQNTVPNPARIEAVYNISVEGAHCYFANGILVHNCDALSRAYEPELFLTFPKLKGTMTSRAISAARESEPDNWQNW